MDKIVKNEFFACSAPSFCRGCLSTERTLSTVTDFVDIYKKLCDQAVDLPGTAQLCWECKALLNKVKIFTKKIAEAQIMLQFCLMKKKPFPQALTSLTTSQVDTNQIQLTHEEKETKHIKLETDDDHVNDYDFIYSIDNVKDEFEEKSIKVDKNDDMGKNESENIETITDNDPNEAKGFSSKINEKRKAKYRFINTDMRKHRGYLIRTLPVDTSEVVPQLEVERRQGDFLKADHKCLGCVEVFNDENGLLKHCKKYHNESLPCVCDVCRSRFPTSAALLAHVSKHNVKKECRVCREQSVAAGTMAQHVRVHHRIVQCIQCELFFKNVRLFYNHHKALHTRFVCDVCGKQRRSRELLEKHMRYHFGYKCPHCDKVLKNSSSYNNHVECQHGASFSDDAYCVPCDRRFKNVKFYKRHLMDSAAHARERDYNRSKRKFPCPECSNVYSRRTYMNNHYTHVHSKQSKHYCEDCDRHFLNRTRYLDHRRFKHEGVQRDKDKLCNICGRGFAVSSLCSRHEGVQRDKDKLCNICGRGFAANRTLINHIRTHSGERPFGCSYCGAKFTQKHAMLSHVKFIHLKTKRKNSWHE